MGFCLILKGLIERLILSSDYMIEYAFDAFGFDLNDFQMFMDAFGQNFVFIPSLSLSEVEVEGFGWNGASF